MIAAKTKDGNVVYVTFCDDLEPNEGGYYCQVYTDLDLCNQVDDFCIHAEELQQYDHVYIAEQYVQQLTLKP